MMYSELMGALRHMVGIDLTVKLQPAGGVQNKVFPPTYAKKNSSNAKEHEYAIEHRLVDNELVETILIDSIPSQANRLEDCLTQAIGEGLVTLPVFSLTIDNYDPVTSLSAPHRALDAIFISSDLGGRPFLESEIGKSLNNAEPARATALYRYAPTALVFGMWNSHSGKLSGRFSRIISSEIIGWGNLSAGVKTSSRIDPYPIRSGLELYESPTPARWTFEKPENKSKSKKPSDFGLGNIAPTVERDTGGVSVAYIQQHATIALLALQGLHFPDDDGRISRPRDDAARVVIASIALLSLALQLDRGYFLRSGSLLQMQTAPTWRLLGRSVDDDQVIQVSSESALTLFEEAVAEAEKQGLVFSRDIPELSPSDKLLRLVRDSETFSKVKPDNE